MHDRPTKSELLHAVQQFLEADAVPALQGPAKFHARVAANVLAIVQRELAAEESDLRREWESIAALLELAEAAAAATDGRRRQIRHCTEVICDRIRQGDADAGPWRATLLAHLRRTVAAKLAVANPKYLASDSAAAEK